jgi:acylphosphatase
MPERLRALIRGNVQGVSFRWFVGEEAMRLGLRGWVRNRRDGRVEVLAEGERDALTALLEELRRGPRYARVEGVDIDWTEASGEFADFRIIPTV